jgi:hypothetical protein
MDVGRKATLEHIGIGWKEILGRFGHKKGGDTRET